MILWLRRAGFDELSLIIPIIGSVFVIGPAMRNPDSFVNNWSGYIISSLFLASGAWRALNVVHPAQAVREIIIGCFVGLGASNTVVTTFGTPSDMPGVEFHALFMKVGSQCFATPAFIAAGLRAPSSGITGRVTAMQWASATVLALTLVLITLPAWVAFVR